jgi:hypothetical protein
MELPPTYQIRARTPDDLDAVAEILVADDLHDGRESVLDADSCETSGAGWASIPPPTPGRSMGQPSGAQRSR